MHQFQFINKTNKTKWHLVLFIIEQTLVLVLFSIAYQCLTIKIEASDVVLDCLQSSTHDNFHVKSSQNFGATPSVRIIVARRDFAQYFLPNQKILRIALGAACQIRPMSLYKDDKGSRIGGTAKKHFYEGDSKWTFCPIILAPFLKNFSEVNKRKIILMEKKNQYC